MSTVALSPTQPSFESLNRKATFQPERWLWIVPTITAVAIGMIFIPHFGLGLIAGALECTLIISSIFFLQKMGILKKDNDSQYSSYGNYISKNMPFVTIFAPLIEEDWFRGGIQPCLNEIIRTLIPATATPFLGTGLTCAATVSIVATATLFGAMHLSNEHSKPLLNAISAGIGGIPLGILADQFNVGVAFASHLMFNSIIAAAFSLTKQFPDDLPKVHPIIDAQPS
jgi:membrane protease YdiL (CAAX protease family)